VTVKVDMVEPGVMRVRFPARSWELAHDVVEDLKARPPNGYRLVESQVKPRGRHRSGRRCNLRLVFIHIDDRIPKLATSKAKEIFEPYAQDAQGVTE
jgi:hypothetical protein